LGPGKKECKAGINDVLRIVLDAFILEECREEVSLVLEVRIGQIDSSLGYELLEVFACLSSIEVALSVFFS
jgi:hypothetical protein